MADPNPMPEIKIIDPPPWLITAKVLSVLLALIAAVLLVTANILMARSTENAVEFAKDVERSNECFYNRTAEISDVNDKIDLWTFKGLRASVMGDQKGLDKAIQEGDKLTAQFSDMIRDRAAIVEECSALQE